jgi:deoxycytidine triphosphate deaminase
MSVIGRETLLRLKDKLFTNHSYDLQNFDLSSYGLRVAGKEILLNGKYYKVYDRDQIDILPHQITFVSTEEILKLPYNLMGQVILRFGYSSKGLDLLAGHIDPLFEGRVVLALLNNSNSPITIIPGDSIANLIIHQVSQDILISNELLDGYKKKFTKIPHYIIDDWYGRHQPNLDSIVTQHSNEIVDIHKQIEVMNSTSQIVITGGIVLVATTILSVVLQVVFALWESTSGWAEKALVYGGNPEVVILLFFAIPIVTTVIFAIFIFLIARNSFNKKKEQKIK